MLQHPPSQILQTYLVLKGGVGTFPSQNSGTPFWPMYVSSMPAENDNAIALYDTSGPLEAKNVSGKTTNHFGIQVRVRTSPENYGDGWKKVYQVARILDSIFRVPVNVEGVDYVIQSAILSSPPIPIGEEEERRRQLFTVNARLTILTNALPVEDGAGAVGGSGSVSLNWLTEIPTGTVNGVNKTFTLSRQPTSLFVYLNGLRQREGLGNDYVLGGQSVTFSNQMIPMTGDLVEVTYTY